MPSRARDTASLHLRGHVLPSGRERDLWIVDGRITFVEAAGARTVADGGWILPGLVDAHAHLELHSPVDGSPRERAVASARTHRDAGVLMVREPGGQTRVSSTLTAAEGLPRIVTAGRFLAPPDGYVPGLAREVTPALLPAAVLEEALVSGAWVKLIGDFVAPGGTIEGHWDDATLRAAVDAAHGAGARITVHATAPAVIEAAVLAGVDAIEHGTGMRPDHIDLLLERGVAWIPTLMIDHAVRDAVHRLAGNAAGATVDEWLRRLPTVVAVAADAGVPVFAGTDAGMSPHGRVTTEVARLLAAGVDVETAIGAASWSARAWLGMPGVEEGAPADLTVHEIDPRQDARSLDRPHTIVLDGRLVRTAPHASGSGTTPTTPRPGHRDLDHHDLAPTGEGDTMFMGSYRFEGDPSELLARYEQMLTTIGEDGLDLQTCVADAGGITIYDTCQSAEVFGAFSTSDDLHQVIAGAGLPAPVVTPLGEVHAAIVAGRRVAAGSATPSASRSAT